MNKEMTCIVCPNGCTLKLDYEIREGKPVLAKVTGNLCPRGLEYARQELLAPKRTIASSVLVEGGELPLVSVRTGVHPERKNLCRDGRNPEMPGKGSGSGRNGAAVQCTGVGSRCDCHQNGGKE